MDQISDAAAALNIADGNNTPKAESPAAPLPAGMFPELSPGRSINAGKTLEETLADLKKSPLFMDELDMDNEQVEAMQALAYDGTPMENALNFKEQGNESFREKRWADAKEFYGKGIAILAAEEIKRKRKAEGLAPLTSTLPKKPTEDETTVDAMSSNQSVGTKFTLPTDPSNNKSEQEEEEDPSEIPQQLALLEQLYVNRAASHLELGNFRSCTLDCAFALLLNPRRRHLLPRCGRPRGGLWRSGKRP